MSWPEAFFYSVLATLAAALLTGVLNRYHIRQIKALKAEAAQEAISALALEFALRFGGIDGDHHKAWVIDQMVRALTGEGYEAWVVEACAGEDGPNTYGWEEGIAP